LKKRNGQASTVITCFFFKNGNTSSKCKNRPTSDWKLYVVDMRFVSIHARMVHSEMLPKVKLNEGDSDNQKAA